MPVNYEQEKSLSGFGYYVTSVYSVREMLKSVISEIENRFVLDTEYPGTYQYRSDAKVLKVTVTVEEV